MKNLKSSILVSILTVFIFSSCSRRIMDFTLISTKNVDLTKGANFVRGKAGVEGKDMIHWIIILSNWDRKY